MDLEENNTTIGHEAYNDVTAVLVLHYVSQSEGMKQMSRAEKLASFERGNSPEITL